MNNYCLQSIGFLGVLLFILSYQAKSNRALYVLQALGSGSFCLQFFLMGQFSGSYSLLVIVLRNVMMMHYQQWPWVRWKGWPAVFSALCVVILIVTWTGPLSLLPFLALLVSNLLYLTNNAQKIRLANLVCACPCWLVYDVLIHSWGGVLNEAITLTSIIVSIYRYGWKALGNNQFETKKRGQSYAENL